MISGIYPYIMAVSGAGLKKFENSFQNAANASIDTFRKNGVAEGESPNNPLATNDGIGLAVSGSVSPGSAGLFAQVSDIVLGQEIPQMIVAERGYEAYLKTIQAQDELTEYTLDTFA